jgi:hypothetical protein
MASILRRNAAKSEEWGDNVPEGYRGNGCKGGGKLSVLDGVAKQPGGVEMEERWRKASCISELPAFTVYSHFCRECGFFIIGSASKAKWARTGIGSSGYASCFCSEKCRGAFLDGKKSNHEAR